MASDKCNLQEDERLSIEVEKYPCRYNKREKGYKEKDRKKNVWKKIDEELGLEEGNQISFSSALFIFFSVTCKNSISFCRSGGKKFEILKKRFSRKRTDAKRNEQSGSGLYDGSKAKKAYAEYQFMGWYEQYIREKKTATNVALNHTSSQNLSDLDEDEQNEELSETISRGFYFG